MTWSKRASGLYLRDGSGIERPGRRPHLHPATGVVAGAQMTSLTAGAGSNLQVAMGGFAAPSSGTTGTQVSVTGLVFQPKFVLLWMFQPLSSGDANDNPGISAEHTRVSVGMFNDAGEAYSWSIVDLHNNANTNAGSKHNTGLCLLMQNYEFGTNNQIFRSLNFTSMNSDGFTLEISSSGTLAFAGQRINYLAFGGSDLSMTKIGTQTVTNALGNQSFTPLASAPKVLLFPNMGIAVNTFSGSPAPVFGGMTGAGQEWTWGGSITSNLATMDTYRYLRSDECQSQVVASSVGNRVRAVSLDATGWTLNRLEVSSNWTLVYGALGGNIYAKAFTFSASSAGASLTGFGFRPKAIIFCTHGTTESTANTTQSDLTFSLGAAIAGAQLCSHFRDQDNVADSRIARGRRNDGVIITSDGAGAIDSRISVSSLDADGFTYTMPTSTLNGYLVGGIALG